MKPWKAATDHQPPVAPPPPHDRGHAFVPPHVVIIEGLEAVSEQLVHLETSIKEIRSGHLHPAAAN